MISTRCCTRREILDDRLGVDVQAVLLRDLRHLVGGLRLQVDDPPRRALPRDRVRNGQTIRARKPNAAPPAAAIRVHAQAGHPNQLVVSNEEPTTMAANTPARAGASQAGIRRVGSTPSTTFSATVNTGTSMKCWCTIPMPAAMASPGPVKCCSSPSMRISPSSAEYRP